MFIVKPVTNYTQAKDASCSLFDVLLRHHRELFLFILLICFKLVTFERKCQL